MYTRIVGDTHGKMYDYQTHSLANHSGPSIQVGDYGIGFAGPYWHDNVASWQVDNPQHLFLRGNHDNLSICKSMPNFIPDGTIKNNVMFIGGAWSIDRAWRTEGVDWWADEECSSSQLYQLIETYAIARPRIMITHDCPTQSAVEMFLNRGLLINGLSAKLHNTRTASALQAMYEIHQPDFWFFGHYHYTTHLKLGNTHFQCIGELDYIDFDLETQEFKLD